jgi:hypothetical protein
MVGSNKKTESAGLHHLLDWDRRGRADVLRPLMNEKVIVMMEEAMKREKGRKNRK